MPSGLVRGIRSSQVGLVVNALLAIGKILAGLLGNSYALIADGVESTADVFSSLIVWGGLAIAARDADEDYPFGYGKAETLAAVVVSLMLFGAATGIAIQATREIVTPHHAPAPWTLLVLVGVVLIKETLFRRVFSVGADVGSAAVKADAWHHRSDAITSVAAFVGIAVAWLGGPGWESADDWAALGAAAFICWNGGRMLRHGVADLMDRVPDSGLVAQVEAASRAVPGVKFIEKIRVRRAGLTILIDLHVQADPSMSLRDAHSLSGAVKAAIRARVPSAAGVLIHMEPYEPA